jgi:hypothetical protein
MDRLVRRVCPHCGNVIVLNYCSIYPRDERLPGAEAPARPARSTRRGAPAPAPALHGLSDVPPDGVLDDPIEDLFEELPPAPRPAPRIEAKPAPLWSWTPPPPPRANQRGSWFRPQPSGYDQEPPLKPLTDFPAGLLARRVCHFPDCGQLLPPDLDERQAHILSVVGLNAAGKTYYLATALTEATNGSGLDAAGFLEFEPDEETAQRFFTDYYSEVYRDNRLLLPTRERSGAHQESLNFRTRIDGGRPMLVMTHDVAGETLMNFAKRAQDASFLRRSSAVIFLVDPLEFDAVREHAHDQVQGRTIHQRDLLAATLRELEFAPGRRQVPVAVVISKADLLEPFLPDGFPLLGPAPRRRGQTEEDWLADLKQTSAVVREVLLELGQGRLVRAAESFGDVSFHAVSALGGRPAPGGPIRPNPRRVLDPLALVLWRLSNALA